MGPELDSQQVADQLQKMRDYRPSGFLVSLVLLTIAFAVVGVCFTVAWLIY